MVFAIRVTCVVTSLLLAIMIGAQSGAQTSAPHLERRGNVTQLIVDGKPFMILGGEVHNSSSSSVEYMESVWPRLTALHLNTVVLPAAWETIEPEEGHFDFRNIDGLLSGARANNLKLVFLWFGAWKNTYSSYAPGWVKRNTSRFPRVQSSSGRNTERLSPFSNSVREADAKAFGSLMAHLKQVDGGHHTVLMMQAENEVGVIPESRDYSKAANYAFAERVPPALMQSIKAHRDSLNPSLRAAWEAAGGKMEGTWQQVFGTGSLTDDLFMAWYYANYINAIATAGKAEYSIPIYANAALIRPNYEPGQYNSGGPLPHSQDIWRAGAPSLDFVSPDIYFNEFIEWATAYTGPKNPLFIPEAQGGVTGAANSLYAFGRLNAIGFSPFGIDDLNNAPLDLVGITNPAEHPDASALGSMYDILSHLEDRIVAAQQTGSITATLIENEAQRSAHLRIGGYMASVSRVGNPAAFTRVGVMLIQTAPDEFLIVGSGDAQMTFAADQGPDNVGIDSLDEQYFENGTWTSKRRLNGDESSQGQGLRLYASDVPRGRIYRLRLYRYH